MSRRQAVMDLGPDEWLDALGIDKGDIPRAVIMEGSWWREQRTAWRLSSLENVRELAFPDMFCGMWRGVPVVYSCVYGAPRAVELAHLFGVLGTPRMVMIGTCGALDPALATGDVVVPSTAVAREGVAQLYGVPDKVESDQGLTRAARSALETSGIRTWDVLHLTWSSIFAQSGAMVEEWKQLGYGLRIGGYGGRHSVRGGPPLRIRRHRLAGGLGPTGQRSQFPGPAQRRRASRSRHGERRHLRSGPGNHYRSVICVGRSSVPGRRLAPIIHG